MEGKQPRRLRVVFALGFTPRVDAPHGGRAAAAMIRALAAEHDVAVIYLHDASLPGADDAVASECASVESVPGNPRDTGRGALRTRARLARGLARRLPTMVVHTHVPEFGRRLHELVKRFDPDVIHFEPMEMAQYMDSTSPSQARRVVVVHEPGFAAAAERRGSHPLKRAIRRLDLLAWSRFERTVGAKADLLITLTDRDERTLRTATNAAIARVPLAIPMPDRPLDPVGTGPTALFVGGYTHPPNEDAALRLLRSIWPRVRNEMPDAELQLVGARPTAEMLAAVGPGAAVRGHVSDLEPLLDRAAVVVLPIRLGGGMRVKTIEALAAGKAIVASSRALDGLEVVDGEQLLIAESDAEFADATIRLLGSSDLRRRLGTAARAWAEAHVSVEAVAAAYARLYRSLVSNRDGRTP